MTDDSTPLNVPQVAERVQALQTALGLADGALAAVAFAWIERAEALIAIKDIATGRYVNANARMAALFRRTPQQMIGHIDAELHDPEQAAVWRNAELAAAARGTPHHADHRVTVDQVRREFQVMRIVLPSPNGTPRFLCSVWTETTAQRQRDVQFGLALQQLEQQQQAAEALRRQSQENTVRDNVTGVFQSEHFDDQLRREFDLSSRENREFALVSVALDPPDDDTRALGEEGRLRVREALGRVLRSNTRAMDGACRIEEDRFAILLSGVGLATAHTRMEGLRRQCATQVVVLNGRDIGFTVSMGIASFPHTADSERNLLDACAAALEQARKRGGNHVALASIRFDGSLS